MTTNPGPRRRTDDPNTSDIGSARISPRTDKDAGTGDVLSGGDASRAPQSLRERDRGRIERASSGKSWDDPDEL
ncbi:hypothetical protein [Cellulomonas sp. PhB143]|uniref:hypothetical protein n=1 Tax=Cellulomonas sp. PhB143 TaxID=2485186 RepID=UPI000F4A37EF|nr:hypothetical protein [Cellulomonas sp. PhB143]ROS78959.1 hypothetical protein EDF32_0253 [Cellulomonas sp. PhB143]